MIDAARLPDWAIWETGGGRYTIGIEEELMLLDPDGFALASRGDEVLHSLPAELRAHAAAETHAAVLELATGAHEEVADAAAELGELRAALESALAELGLRAAAAGTHPTASWQATVVSADSRYQSLHDSLRELARREPTFAMHVHIGVPDPEQAVELANRLRVHAPMLLGLSANSPFWQGRDTGLASARTPVFQAFPRVGLPRRFTDYRDWVETVDLLVGPGAIPDPSFLWWDVRLQPRLGTVEIRVMDAQTTVGESASLAALIQSLAHRELAGGPHPGEPAGALEALAENRFLAARDGAEGRIIDLETRELVAIDEVAESIIAGCERPAAILGCSGELAATRALLAENGAKRQRRLATGREIEDVTEALADLFTGSGRDEQRHGRRPPLAENRTESDLNLA